VHQFLPEHSAVAGLLTPARRRPSAMMRPRYSTAACSRTALPRFAAPRDPTHHQHHHDAGPPNTPTLRSPRGILTLRRDAPGSHQAAVRRTQPHELDCTAGEHVAPHAVPYPYEPEITATVYIEYRTQGLSRAPAAIGRWAPDLDALAAAVAAAGHTRQLTEVSSRSTYRYVFTQPASSAAHSPSRLSPVSFESPESGCTASLARGESKASPETPPPPPPPPPGASAHSSGGPEGGAPPPLAPHSPPKTPHPTTRIASPHTRHPTQPGRFQPPYAQTRTCGKHTVASSPVLTAPARDEATTAPK
jgi:hypothetical protein